MKASSVFSTITKGLGIATLAAAAVIVGVCAYASVKVPRSERSFHV